MYLTIKLAYHRNKPATISGGKVFDRILLKIRGKDKDKI